MNGAINKEKIEELADTIATGFKPDKIILFGSQAWGEPTQDSDIDLFMIKETSARRIDRAREVRELIWNSGLPVDIVVYTPSEVAQRISMNDFFINDIMQKGRLLYSAS